jgi:predicted tellurium resistance membrane protein TerC
MAWFNTHEMTILLTIVVINVTLSGDNAVAMATCCNSSVPRQRIGAAIIATTVVGAAQILVATMIIRLLALPVVGLLGAAFLVYRALRLMLSEQSVSPTVEENDGNIGFCVMVLKVTAANLITSGDNILAVAAVSEGREDLVAIGLMICLPVIVFGSLTIISLLTRYPVILLVVAGRLGYVAGGMGVRDSLWANWLTLHFRLAVSAASALLAAALIVIGAWCILVRRPALIDARGRDGSGNSEHLPDVE